MKRSDWSQKSGKPVDPNAELDRMWGALKAQDHADSLPAMMAAIKRARRRDGGRVRRRGPGFCLRSRPALARGAAVFFVVLALAAACQIPVAQDLRDGFFVQWTVDGTPATATARLARYDWIDDTRLSISTIDGSDETTFLLWLPQAGADHAEVLRNVLAADSANRAVAVYPVGHRTHRPLYEAALRVISIEVHESRLTDQEVQEKIAAHLAAQGLAGYKIEYRKSGDENKIEITLPPDPQ